LAFALTSACGKKEDDKPKEPVATTDPAAAEPAAEPAPEPKKEEPKLTKKKLGELTTFDYMDILKAKGWTDAASGGMAMGAWKSSTITAKQGDKEAKLTIVEPSGAKEDPKASIKAQSPKEQLAKLQAAGAAELLGDDVLLAVTIEGDTEGAKALLAHVKEWIIVE
jgi:hypothetical protein